MNPKNASFVIESIRAAANGCLSGDFSAMVTGPISKSILNKGGFKISGHTEFLAEICKSKSIMMLMNDRLKVTLQTIHIPLAKVPKEITEDNLIHHLTRGKTNQNKNLKYDLFLLNLSSLILIGSMLRVLLVIFRELHKYPKHASWPPISKCLSYFFNNPCIPS